jgi:hypothetical protein
MMFRPRFTVVMAAATLLLIAACAATPPPTPEPITLATQPPPVSSACDAALGGGRLVPDPRSGLAVAGPDGVAMPVAWPNGYAAAIVDGQIVLLDANGQAVAVEGDTVQFGGGLGVNDFFWVCPAEVTVVVRAQ